MSSNEKKEHLIYALAGKFFSRSYKLVNWKFNEAEILAPTPSLALFKYYKEKGVETKLKILIPLSIFKIEELLVNINNKLSFDNLVSKFKTDFENFYTNKLQNLLNRFKDIDIKESKQVYKEIKAFVSFFNENINWKNLDGLFEEVVNEEKNLKKFVDVLNNSLKENEILEKLKDTDKEWKKLFQNSIEYEIIPSIGLYKKEVEKDKILKILKFNGRFQDRVLYFYTLFGSDFIQRIQKINNSKFNVYLDVSIGLNSLVVELLESFYNAIVLWNFYFLGKEENKGSFYLISAEPINDIPNREEPKYFSTEQIKKLTFFAKPLAKKQIKELGSISSNFKKFTGFELNKIINQSILLFNILEKGIILGLTLEPQLIKSEKIIEILKRFLNQKKELLKLNIKETEIQIYINPKNYNYFSFRNLTYLLMLGTNIVKNIQNSFPTFYKEKETYINLTIDGLPIEQTIKNFKQLFKQYNLDMNNIFLEKEWDKNRILGLKKRANGKPKLLIEFNKNKNYKQCYKNLNPWSYIKNKGTKRNFLAHMGTEDCITEVYKENEILYLKYRDDFKKAIREFIINDFEL